MKNIISYIAVPILISSFSFNASALQNCNEQGQHDFINHCASCHGRDGKGNGPMASELKGTPSNLTLLSKNNDGHFPYRRVRKIIDGRVDEGNFRSHSSREMPIWGNVFRSELSIANGRQGGCYAYAKVKILNIVEYLDEIQVK